MFGEVVARARALGDLGASLADGLAHLEHRVVARALPLRRASRCATARSSCARSRRTCGASARKAAWERASACSMRAGDESSELLRAPLLGGRVDCLKRFCHGRRPFLPPILPHRVVLVTSADFGEQRFDGAVPKPVSANPAGHLSTLARFPDHDRSGDGAVIRTKRRNRPEWRKGGRASSRRTPKHTSGHRAAGLHSRGPKKSAPDRVHRGFLGDRWSRAREAWRVTHQRHTLGVLVLRRQGCRRQHLGRSLALGYGAPGAARSAPALVARGGRTRCQLDAASNRGG